MEIGPNYYPKTHIDSITEIQPDIHAFFFALSFHSLFQGLPVNDNNQFNNSGSSNNSNWDDQKRPPNINNNYLNSLKPSIGSETNKWMLNLKEDLSNQLPDLIPHSSNELNISHDKISNKLYDQLSKYAFEFSKDVASQELKISTELPSKVNIPSTSLIPNGKSNYGLQGHLYTRKWSLVLRSEPAMIKVFVIAWALICVKVFKTRSNSRFIDSMTITTI